MGKKNLAVFLFGLVSLLGVGCSSIDRYFGHYEGTLLDRHDGEIFKHSVSVELKRDGSRASAEVIDQNGTALFYLSAMQLTQHSFLLQMPPPWSSEIRVHKKGNCFIGKKHSVSVCFSDEKFLFDFADQSGQSVFTLTADRFAHAEIRDEKPRKYTLSEAIDFAQKKSFESRIEYEHLIRARRAAKAAYLKLLPRLTVSGVLSNLEPSLGSLLFAIGDFAPFLLPNRWMQAKRASHSAEAEKDAMILMRMDMGSQAEGLSYALARDKESEVFYDYMLGKAELALKKVVALGNQVPPGSDDHLMAYIKWMKMDRIAIRALITQDKRDLSRALGFVSPHAVEDVVLDQDSHSIIGAQPIDEEEIRKLAIARSFELRQMDHLIESAKTERRESFFSWMDPSESSDYGGIGFYTGQLVKINNSQIYELFIKRQQLQAIVGNKAVTAVQEWNAAIASYAEVEESTVINERRINRVIEDIKPDLSVNTLDMEGILQDYLAAGLRKLAIVASFRVAAAKLERLTLEGHYVSVPPTVDSPLEALFSFEF